MYTPAAPGKTSNIHMHDDHLEPIFLFSGMLNLTSMTRARFRDCLEALLEVAFALLGFAKRGRENSWLHGLCLSVLRRVIARSQELKSALRNMMAQGET